MQPPANYNPEAQRVSVTAVLNAAVQQIVTQLDTLLAIAQAQHEQIVLLQHENDALKAAQAEPAEVSTDGD